MTTIIKIIITSLLSLMLLSCKFDLGTHGNGNVQIEERTITEPFSAIQAAEGLNVSITQGNETRVLVEADKNLQELILVDVENGVLKIHTKEPIGRATSKKVSVTFKDISKIISTSGSDVYATNTITAESLELKTTSGSDMTLDINTTTLNCKSTSGSDLTISGKTEKLVAEATSGSDIKAGDLKAKSSEAKATSGANITINTSKELIANASSGGDIKYYGNPQKIDISNNVSGSIKKK